jgi:hypothetical protein
MTFRGPFLHSVGLQFRETEAQRIVEDGCQPRTETRLTEQRSTSAQEKAEPPCLLVVAMGQLKQTEQRSKI